MDGERGIEGRIDGWLERGARAIARRSSRRGFLARLGAVLFGGAALPLLPVARGSAQAPREPAPEEGIEGPEGNPTRCEYWRYCGIDGFLSTCCGGTVDLCPPGTEMSTVTWIGTCRNPADGREYIISYNDCCGSALCGRCMCNRNEGDTPAYMPPKSNDINWCMGTESQAYSSTVAIVLGVATEETPRGGA